MEWTASPCSKVQLLPPAPSGERGILRTNDNILDELNGFFRQEIVQELIAEGESLKSIEIIIDCHTCLSPIGMTLFILLALIGGVETEDSKYIVLWDRDHIDRASGNNR